MTDPYDQEPPADDSPYRDPAMLPLASEVELARPPAITWPKKVITAGYIAYGVMVVLGVTTGTFTLIDAIPLVPILAFFAFHIATRIGRIDRDDDVTQIVYAAFWAKMLGALAKAAVVAWSYNNVSDASEYHQFGKTLAPMFRSFDFSQAGPWSGTDFMRNLAGIIYSFTGASQVSGAIVMSFLSFVGSVLLWRAFKLAIPTGNHRRYALLVLFLPSLLYWPSSLGKESWAIFCLGVGSYGVARVLTGRVPDGVLLVGAALFGVSLLRPHVALTMFCGIALAGLVGRPRGSDVGKASLLRLLLFGVLLAVGSYLATSTAEFFGVPSLNQETVNQQLADAEGRTQEAGSVFTPYSMSNPANTPMAFVTVLFRPFPFEASSAVAAASAMEGIFLIWLTWHSRRRVRSIFRCMRREPYTAYCVGVMLTLIYAFSAFSNFGILARQRSQVLPFFLVLLCLPEWNREGVITSDEAVAGRDALAPAEYDVTPIDPYQETVDPTASDPYSAHDVTPDPYRRP